MLQNRAVFFIQNVFADLNNVIRCHAQNKTVIRRMMQLTKRKTIFYR